MSAALGRRTLSPSTLDLTACALIKVDVDGKELEVLRSAEMTIERFRPILYFENDVRAVSADLLEFVMQTLGYHLYWRSAPVFSEDNYFGNPINHWVGTWYLSWSWASRPSDRTRLPLWLRSRTRTIGRNG
jgi:hypothetical protein